MLSTARGGVDTELVKRLTIRQILVPIDFSEMSIGAIQPAKNLAQRFQANVHLANICEQFYPTGFYAAPAPAPLSAFTYLETVRRTAAQRLKTLAKERHLSGDCYAQSGAPVFDEICRIAQEIPADLIVTSTHGRTGLKHVVLGSTAERLVQHSPCPVLVARETKTKSKSAKPGIDRILVPVDFSDCSLAGLNYAVQVADKFAATIVILHVVSLGALLTADGYGMYDLSLYEKRAVADAERQMRRFVRRVKFGGTKFETIVESGASVAGICEVARRKHVDLIITATHGWTGFKHLLIGSTAEQVVRHAPCPVLVVPSHPKVRARQLASRARPARTPARPKALRTAMKQSPRESEQFTKRFRKTASHSFPELRKTNKFRESHSLVSNRGL